MKLHFQYKNNGQIVSYSKGKIISPAFSQIELDITDEQLEMLRQNYGSKISNGNIIFEKPPEIKKQEDTEQLKQKVQKVKSVDELKDVLLEILGKV